MISPFCVLTIAGSDSGGGAGIQADQRTIRALGGHALTAVTAITAQDTERITVWAPVPDELIGAQIASAFGGFRVAAAKTGLLASPGAVRAVASALAGGPAIPLVVDPVLASSSGTVFLPPAGVRALKQHLFTRATLVTPNWAEAQALAAITVRTHAKAADAGRRIADACGRPVLVKGGHAPRGACRDCLVLPGGKVSWFTHRRIATGNTHGTGCVLSSAIAAWLGRGASLEDAIRLSQSFLMRGLERGRGLGWGRGRGPAYFGSR